ncbi:hypothetical protein ACTMU2_39290 [Cupriavidus basilensis]
MLALFYLSRAPKARVAAGPVWQRTRSAMRTLFLGKFHADDEGLAGWTSLPAQAVSSRVA